LQRVVFSEWFCLGSDLYTKNPARQMGRLCSIFNQIDALTPCYKKICQKANNASYVQGYKPRQRFAQLPTK
jgi:hypothetical protein